MIRHLFWDFDGTLYDSYPQVVADFCRALVQLDISYEISPDKVLQLLKVSLHHAADFVAAHSGQVSEKIIEAYHHNANDPHDFVPYQDMEECLRTLYTAGFRHYLYTHREQSAITQLQKDGLWPLFSDAVLRTDGFAAKPAPDALFAMMKRNGLQASECAMIGDRDIDVLAGQNAGMIGILFDPAGFYPTLKADVRVVSMKQLCGVLK